MAATAGDGCGFTLQVPSYPERYPWLDAAPGWALDEDDPGVVDGVWHCPHDEYRDTGRCPFHLAPEDRPPELDVSRRLENTVARAATADTREIRTRRCQFVGARFPELDLERTTVGGDSRVTIDFRHATFGIVACKRVAFVQPVVFSGATFDPGPAPVPAPGREVLDPALGQVDYGIDFTDARFEDIVYFRDARFERPALFREAVFEDRVGFDRVRFRDHVSFLNAAFADILMFNDGVFHRELRLQSCDLEGFIDFKRSYIGGRVNLDRLRCPTDVEFDNADFTAPPSATPADAPAGFRGRLTADDATIGGHLSVVGTTLDAPLRIRDSDLGTIRVDPAADSSGVCYVDLARTSVQRGRLAQPPEAVADGGRTGVVDADPARPESRAVYDLFKTTLGEVTFDGPADVVERSVRFLRTRYDGFHFADDDALDIHAAGYRIHALDVGHTALPCYCVDTAGRNGRYVVPQPDCPRHHRSTDAAALEETYAYAKNGADEVGDDAAAGVFFYQEMAHRRTGHRDRLLGRRPGGGLLDRLRAGSRWGRSWVMALSTGYGEYPYRVVTASLAVIGGFAAVYNAEDVVPGLGISEAVTFSFQSYVSFALGAPETETLAGQALTAIEGFMGAFLVALFVFTLTRRVNR